MTRITPGNSPAAATSSSESTANQPAETNANPLSGEDITKIHNNMHSVMKAVHKELLQRKKPAPLPAGNVDLTQYAIPEKYRAEIAKRSIHFDLTEDSLQTKG